MESTPAFCRFFREVLTFFSNRCIEQLIGRAAGQLPRSITQDHLRDNVEKEAAKDCLVIERAAEAYESGTRLGERSIDELFTFSQEIDRAFIGRLTLPSFSFEARYEAIEEIRKKRFRYIADFTADLLEVMEGRLPFADAVRKLYSADQFHGFIGEVLFLYCVEVKKLAGMIRFLPPFNKAMEDFIDEVVEAMETVRHEVADRETRRLFPGEPPRKRMGIQSRGR
jgi:hypothetical protein